jgi:site-specific DNA recombinase
MENTNGRVPQRAVLYARVSTEEQAKSGYSLAQQLEVLRKYAVSEGYEVLEEVTDPGHSGASLERPGLDRVRDLVAAGSVSVVLAQDRDRFAREPAYHYLLRKEFEEYGTKIRSLNDRGDGSPEGELTDGILDQLAKYERAKVAERTRRGLLRKAKEGKLVAGPVPNYGFRYNRTRDGYLVDEERMAVVRRIFRMVGVEGMPLHRVKRILEHERVPTPTGGRYWNNRSIRDIIMDDDYKPHSYTELRTLLSPEVAARLNSEERYGIWWFNRRRTSVRQVVETGPEGRSYRRRQKTVFRPRGEWIAVPVPYAGVPREWVDNAREAIENNRRPSSAGDRFWELLGGVFFCGGCGCRMRPDRRRRSPRDGRLYYYYRCPTRHQKGKDACSQPRSYQATQTEARVWEFIAGLLKDPDRLRAGLERMVDQERDGLRGDPEREAKEWRRKLSEVAAKRARLQDMAAEGLLTLEELRDKLTELDEVREATELELSLLQNRVERVEALQRSKVAVLASLEETVPKALGELNAEERRQLYEMLKVRLTAGVDGTLELNGKLVAKHPVCTSGTTPAVCPTHTTMAGPPIYAGSMPNPSGATTPTRTFWT